jgi:hypothetical protein
MTFVFARDSRQDDPLLSSHPVSSANTKCENSQNEATGNWTKFRARNMTGKIGGKEGEGVQPYTQEAKLKLRYYFIPPPFLTSTPYKSEDNKYSYKT